MPTPDVTINFGTVVLTDANGLSLSGSDGTDWQLDQSLSSQEQSFFTPGNSPALCPASEIAAVQPAFPNPAVNNVMFFLQGINNYTLRIRAVDRNYQLLKIFPTLTNVGDTSQAMTLDISDLPKDTVRLYYQLDFGNCVRSGYGDLIVQ